MPDDDVRGADDITRTAGTMVRLGRLALDLGATPRITLHPDAKTYESVTTHTVMLGWSACALAQRWFPGLRVGLVAQYALVHDAVEAICGDTPTLAGLSAEQKAEKDRREAEALVQIRQEMGDELPWIGWMISTYEDLATPEARFVKLIDKIMPKLTHILNDAETIHRQGLTRAQLQARYEQQGRELDYLTVEFPEVEQLRQSLVAGVLKDLPDPETMRPAQAGDVYTEKDRTLPANVLEFRDSQGDPWRRPVGDERFYAEDATATEGAPA